MIARQVREEGVSRIALVTDEPDKYFKTIRWPSGMTIHHRRDLETVQRELAAVSGVTVLIYDQTCAAEKRRRRKRGNYHDPDKKSLSTISFVKHVVIVRCNRIASPSNLWKQSLDVNDR